jgi:glutamine amidotransferase
MKIAIIKYNSGNIASVNFALRRLGVEAIISDSAEEISAADKVIFPGVGEASSAMKFLNEKGLDKVICGLKQPTLGICLGMQLMCEYSEEGKTNCLGIFNHTVKRFEAGQLKIPQVGWNRIERLKTKLFNGVDEDYMYFVHSYYVGKCAETIAVTNYGAEFSSALRKDNFYGVQFHPERSGNVGEKILKNFLEL